MAFNFNWSPLMADADFYKRAQEMLTTALNKSPKPPIIVDDIIVNELNLGSVPPDLEILEIGDLAEDRFRGIFKMCYSGDAFLTLKTKVQANPMNTYLSSTSSFTSPQPLAAASGLMIPLQITLSEIKLSAFIILVFSRQKGLTLVFRNDPLESLKVSSTFDSIPFVRDYLQKEIEIQLRTLMMDELPAIIHRLSLRLWCAENVVKECTALELKSNRSEEMTIDPFASPPLDSIDSWGKILETNQISSTSLDGSPETHFLFSQKNLLRLSALGDSHRTFSLFTPSIRDAVFRAWPSLSDRSDSVGTKTPVSPGLKRTHSITGSTSTICSLNRKSEDINNPNGLSTSPSINGLLSTTGLCLGSTRNARSHLRKKKTRVINLRKPQDPSDDHPNNSRDQDQCSLANESNSTSTTLEPEDKILTPPHSPHHPSRHQIRETYIPQKTQPQHSIENCSPNYTINFNEKLPMEKTSTDLKYEAKMPEESYDDKMLILGKEHGYYQSKKFSKTEKVSSSSSVLGKAWLLKMASELVRRAQDEKARGTCWPQPSTEDAPPPAYEAKFI
ncbi:Mitochondrial distribution and morphology protein 34 [Golovinomyces cichoracearum]|uniref:Mitochondrial distribution and morphology protein 34 n=1 Tax=Golovinomyces cichoracearum TaxID=62708 RepID=A0A420JAQ0_9PEZI|nr:Mitochondrial distribution and morphology protein 34 [Golovinomyces cichoracearum]